MPEHTDCRCASDSAPFSLSSPARFAKFLAKPRCSDLRVKPQLVWPVCTAAGSVLSDFLGGNGHHIVRTQDLNPVTIRVLNEGQAFHFT